VLPLTRIVRTPSGGEHMYFLGGDGIRCSSDTLAVGIDIRGVGGYVVGPGSSIGDRVYELEGSPRKRCCLTRGETPCCSHRATATPFRPR